MKKDYLEAVRLANQAVKSAQEEIKVDKFLFFLDILVSAIENINELNGEKVKKIELPEMLLQIKYKKNLPN